MKVLTIGTDIKIFDTESAVHARALSYASHMQEMHVIVFTTAAQAFTSVHNKNVHIYPTSSSSRFLYIWDAYMLGKKIITGDAFVRGDAVISTQDPFETGLVGYFLKNTFRLPLQLQLHTDFLSDFFKDSFLNRVRVMIASFIVPRATALRVVSESIANSLENRFKLKARPAVLPILVDIEALKNKPATLNIREHFPQFTFIVFMASRLTLEKHIETALYAFEKILKKYPTAGLIIAGEGNKKIFLEKISIRLGISQNVVFVGWQDDLASYYKAANLFLLTSAYEGYGMTLVEAAASGCPIITTPVGIAQTLCKNGENSFVCPVGDAGCFEAHIDTLISDNALRDLFKFKMQDSIQGISLTPSEYSQKYVELLEHIKGNDN